MPWCTCLICIAIYTCHEGGLCVGAVSNIGIYAYKHIFRGGACRMQSGIYGERPQKTGNMYISLYWSIYIHTYTYLAPNLQTYPYTMLVHVCIIVYVYVYNHSLKQVRYTARFCATGHDDTCVFSVCNYIYIYIYISTYIIANFVSCVKENP